MPENDTLWLVGAEDLALVEGGTMAARTITYQGASSVAFVSWECYRDGNDISADALSGSPSASGQVLTLGTITAQANHGDSIYVIVVTCTVDGETDIRKFEIAIVDPAQER